jgi:predicted secreted protein
MSITSAIVLYAVIWFMSTQVISPIHGRVKVSGRSARRSP